jgi:hypothetical protein
MENRKSRIILLNKIIMQIKLFTRKIKRIIKPIGEHLRTHIE